MNENPDLTENARNVLQRLQFMTLATATPDGVPWSTPVFFAYDSELNFYWLSAPDAVHSRNIAENPATSIVIFDSTGRDWDGTLGLYFTGHARQIRDDEPGLLQKAHEVSCVRAGREPGNARAFTGDFPRKYYISRPTAAWVNAVETRNGVAVDIRQEITLDHLKYRPG